MDISGLIVPPTTPFGKGGDIDEGRYAAHLEFLAEKGVTRLLVNGTTAEFFSLLPSERLSLLKITKKYFPGTIFFNTASDSLRQAKETARRAADYGAHALVAMTPYYFAGAPEEGLVAFFNELGSCIDIPLILYNFSRHTNNPITPGILKKVKHVAIKDSSGDYSLIKNTPCYLSGTSRNMVEGHLAGAKGFVSSLANVVPELYVSLEKSLKKDDVEGALLLQEEIKASCAKIPAGNEISWIKKELSAIIKSYPASVRIPLI